MGLKHRGKTYDASPMQNTTVLCSQSNSAMGEGRGNEDLCQLYRTETSLKLVKIISAVDFERFWATKN
jgi:hypothetical protein